MERLQRLRQLLQFDRRLLSLQKLKQGHLAGVDEAGRGPLAGPVVAGAVVLRSSRFTLPIDDSKRLTPSAREAAFQEILRFAFVGVGLCVHEEIDRIGIHAATYRAMLRALARLPVRPRLVLVDGLGFPRGSSLRFFPVVDGDAQSLSIACASIVAKVVRDRWMGWVDRFHPEYGFVRHKGYGTAFHLKVLREIGPCDFHRYSFKPLKPSDVELD